MILLIDHDDSFVYNLAAAITQHGVQARVIRDRELDIAAIEALNPAGIVLSPGPCTPEDSPLAIEVVCRFGKRIPILGVCLGHQVIAVAFGGVVAKARHPLHGMTSSVHHDGKGCFSNIPSPMTATRYHSLAVVEASMPDQLIISARSDDGEVMAIRHRTWPVEGVQFHPESILTDAGGELIGNWLKVRTEK